MTYKENKDNDELIAELVSLSLWCVRRLPTTLQKRVALKDLRCIVEGIPKFREYVDKELSELP